MADHIEVEQEEVVNVSISTLPMRLTPNAAELLAEAKVLDRLAERFDKYTPPHSAVCAAAANLRSAIGHCLP